MTEQLRARQIAGRDRFAVALHELILAIQSRPDDAIWVFEGPDDVKYYGLRIRHYAGREAAPWVNARGRDNLKRLLARVKHDGAFKAFTVIFFMDRDYGQSLPEPADILYVTPGYSIENFYVTSDAFQRVLQEEFAMGNAKKARECTALTLNYQQWLAEFCNAALPICAYLSVQQRRYAGKEQFAPPLPDNAFDQFFAVHISAEGVSVSQRIAPTALQELLRGEFDITAEDVQQEATTLVGAGRPAHEAVRGKFVIEFLRLMLARLSEESSGGHARFSERYRVRMTLSRNNMLAELSRFADTPDCLAQFLQRQQRRPPQ